MTFKPSLKTEIQSNDELLIYTKQNNITKTEKLFLE